MLHRPDAMTRNRLDEETSPYLLQHKDNPVHWQPWDTDALEWAGREDKPILLSIGYAACHWCHVMAHESFADTETAELINTLFVPIKVDREERPDLDAAYQTALALMGEPGGWPLTMFLTPEGKPFWGGTYFPPEPRFGRPGFSQILTAVAEAWREQGERIDQTTCQIERAITDLSRPPGTDDVGPLATRFEAAAHLALRAVDTAQGGTLGAPKFPQPAFFRFLWHAARRLDNGLHRDAVLLTLDHMCQGGIYDHLGGGFARYATDEVWLVPHFEKMLYDNALLVELMTEVWKETRSPLFAARIEETIAWILGPMRIPETPADDDAPAAFAAAFDADSEGEEGRYYVWTEDEIDRLLGADSPVFKESYDVSARGNWEGRTILNRSRARGRDMGMPAVEARLAESRARLLEARNQRVPPLRDNKVLADWNGMTIAALARAGAVFGREDWILAAERAFAFVIAHHVRDGRLRHSWCAGRADHAAVLDDLAHMARAALALYEITGTARYLAHARAWIEEADTHYRDPDDGAYFLTADDVTDVFVRTKSAADTATPAPVAILAEVFARLHHLTGEPDAARTAQHLIALYSPPDTEALLHHAAMLTALDFLEGTAQIAIAGPPADPATSALRRAAFETAPPAAVVLTAAPGADLPPGHPAAGKRPVDGAPAAYVCVNRVCGPPTTDPMKLRHHLGRLRGDRFGPAPDSAPKRTGTRSRR